MIINVHKSTLTAIGCMQHEVHFTLHRFPFSTHPMEEGLKYLSFRLKPRGYKIADWIWLIVKVEEVECVVQQVPYSGRKTHPHKSSAGSNTNMLDVSGLDSKGNSSQTAKDLQ